MQIGGEATWRRGLFCCFSSQYFSLFAYKTGCKIKKHIGVSTRGGVRPNGGGYDPMYLPLCVSYINIYYTELILDPQRLQMLNAHYMVIFLNSRDMSHINALACQAFASKATFLTTVHN